MYHLRTSFITLNSPIQKHFRNSWVKLLVFSWHPIVTQAYEGAYLVAMPVAETWLNILELNEK